MKARAAAAFKAGVGAVALALAVSVAAPVSAHTPVKSGKSSATAKASSKVFRSVKVTPARPVVGTKVTVKGRTKAAKRRLVLQVRTDRGTWRKVAVKRARKNGKFSFTYAVDSAKPRSFRVVARTAPKVKRSTQHLGHGKASKRVVRKVKSRRVVSRVVKVKARPAAPRVKTPAPVVPAPVVPAPVVPAPDADAVFAAAVRGAVDAGVRDYRKANGVSAAGTNQCLTQWADGFAADMARTNIFAHSVSSEWAGRGIVSHSEACLDEAPSVVRQEAIAWEDGATPQEVADKVLRAWQDAWMHDEVLLGDFGHDRVLSVGVAKGDAAHGWYVVAAFGADF